MLNHFEAVDDIEWLFPEVLEHVGIRRQQFESSCRTCFPCEAYTGLGQIDADYGASKFGKLSGTQSISAADVEDARSGPDIRAETQKAPHCVIEGTAGLRNNVL